MRKQNKLNIVEFSFLFISLQLFTTERETQGLDSYCSKPRSAKLSFNGLATLREEYSNDFLTRIVIVGMCAFWPLFLDILRAELIFTKSNLRYDLRWNLRLDLRQNLRLNSRSDLKSSLSLKLRSSFMYNQCMDSEIRVQFTIHFSCQKDCSCNFKFNLEFDLKFKLKSRCVVVKFKLKSDLVTINSALRQYPDGQVTLYQNFNVTIFFSWCRKQFDRSTANINYSAMRHVYEGENRSIVLSSGK